MRSSIGLLPVGALLLAGTFLAAQHADRTPPEPRVLERAAALARLRYPMVGDVRLEVAPVGVQMPSGDSMPVWQVVCRGAAGSELGTVYVDAGTGAPVAAYFAASSPGEHAGREPVDRRDAVKAARGWLRALGMAGRSDAWRLASAPRCDGGQWTVRWTAPGWRACAVVDARTCELVYARCMPCSPPAAPASRSGAIRPL